MGTFHSPSFHGLPQADRIILKYKQKDLLKGLFFIRNFLFRRSSSPLSGRMHKSPLPAVRSVFRCVAYLCGSVPVRQTDTPSLQLVIRISCNIIPRLIPARRSLNGQHVYCVFRSDPPDSLCPARPFPDGSAD